MRLRDRRRRRISRTADPSHRAAGRRQRHRHGRAHPRRRAGRADRPADHRRRPAGRRAHRRARPHREGGAGRLHALHGPDRRAGDHAPPGGQPALCHRARFSADRGRGQGPSAACGIADDTVPDRPGACRLRQAESGKTLECVVEQRLARPCRRRAVQVHDRHRHRARALQGRRAGDQRPDRGARAADVREPQLDRAVRALGRGARARRER